MSNYLLDTCTLLWALSSKAAQLSPLAKRILSDPTNVRTVSTVSFIELSIKQSIGKLKIKGLPLDELPWNLNERGFDLVVLEPFESVRLNRLPFRNIHRDPFDRMLVC